MNQPHVHLWIIHNARRKKREISLYCPYCGKFATVPSATRRETAEAIELVRRHRHRAVWDGRTDST